MIIQNIALYRMNIILINYYRNTVLETTDDTVHAYIFALT